MSFRRVDKNQRWVHLPLTICEALRAFGAEFSCLFPCRTPSCFSNGEREKGEGEREQSSCGAVFARWLVAVEGGKREIELVVGDEEEEEEEKKERGFRRHGVGEIELELKEEQGRVSICVPPKNALLLMRCRSDPLRVNALANRLCECPVPASVDDDDGNEIKEEGEESTELKRIDSILIGKIDQFENSGFKKQGEDEDEVNPEDEIEGHVAVAMKVGEGTEDLEARKSDVNGLIGEEEGERLGERDEEAEVEETSIESSDSASGSVEKTVELEIGKAEGLEIGKIEELAIEKTGEFAILETEELAAGKTEELPIEKTEELAISKTELGIGKTEELLIEDLLIAEEKEEEEERRRISRFSCSSVLSLHLEIAERDLETKVETEDPQLEETEEEIEEKRKTEEREKESVLPDCLLLMRREPKLSMEVSKETWVCSTDFIRWLPKRRPKVNKTHGGDDIKKQNHNIEPNVVPPRSSCSFPAPPPASMASLIEQRLMNAVAYEPFVLTRCKSEPMRTAAAKLMPESCFWKNSKLEPHRSANFSVNTARVGF